MDQTATIIRTATLDDAPRLVEIYDYYVRNTVITFEYATPTVEEFRERMSNIMKRYPYLVAEQDGDIVGYTYARSFIARASCYWAVETTIYMDATTRHAGVGGKMHTALEEMLQAMGIIDLYACISYPKQDDEYLDHNSANFHAHMGYETVGHFADCGFKFNRWYDMVWMKKTLGPRPECPPPLRTFDEVKNILLPRELA